MNYISLNGQAALASFKDAVLRGIAPDRGLYYPKTIKPLDANFVARISQYSNNEIAYKVIEQFVGSEIPKAVLENIINETLTFDFPVKDIEEGIKTLELFHGPTMAFKDVGARFMARCLGYFNKESKEKVTVLVATSGDTGGAVASGFLGVDDVDVVILYPSNKVSEVQEKQLTTLGQNISALEVQGTFDDCQDMVKKAFLDSSITETMHLTSANSINVARWLPQMFYYFFCYKQLASTAQPLVFSVPSGNYGNLCAAMMAKKIGLPIHQFVAATNANAVVTTYLETERYQPKPSIQTISNAMDVGNPSNFIRIQKIYDNKFSELKKELHSYSFDDHQTREAMRHLYTNFNYIADPHGAVAYLGAKKYQQDKPGSLCVFLETAHPVKFLDVVTPIINSAIDLPFQIKEVINKDKKALMIKDYDELKSFLLNKN